MRKHTVVGAVCLFLGWSSISLCGSVKMPNIILVMADDQGWGQTGYNGHPYLKTPNLDAMAAAGIRFNRFYAAGPVCSTSCSGRQGAVIDENGSAKQSHGMTWRKVWNGALAHSLA